MTFDRYTKILLTIIAACQVILVLRETQIITRAEAQSPMHVIVDHVAAYAFAYAGPLQVKN